MHRHFHWTLKLPVMSLRPSIRSPCRSLYAFTRKVSRSSKAYQFPTIESCPSPTCSCTPTPAMPEGLEIDYKKPLNGTMAAFAEQVLICSGQTDWKSRIEEENDGDNLAADLKELLGKGGIYSDPFHNIVIANSSFASSPPPRSSVQTTSAYLFPSFKYVPFLPRVSFDSVQALVKGYLLPTKLNPAHDKLSPIHRDRLLRGKEFQTLLYGVQDVEDIMVLICGHGGRDVRCGIMGAVLQEEFTMALPRKGIEILRGPVFVHEDMGEETKVVEGYASSHRTARLGLISHIGGHKFAGNVIIYLPKNAKTDDDRHHPLAGCGIWYGRIEPQHVEGIVDETIGKGNVIFDHFRGGIRQGGEILRIDRL